MEFLSEHDVPYQYDIYKSGTKKKMNISDLAVENKSDMIITFINGSRVEMFSEDNLFRRIRSREFSKGFFEEATVVQEKFFEKNFYEGIRRVRQMGMPHEIMIATNPDQKTHWLYENIFDETGRTATEKRIRDSLIMAGFDEEEAIEKSRIWVKHLCFKDGYNAGNKEREANILMGSQREIDLFYHGLWGNLEGQAFILQDGVHIQDVPDTPDERHYISFDYGFSPDPMVYLLVKIQNGIIIVVDEIVLSNKPVNTHDAYLDKWTNKYNIVGYTGETATGSGEIRDLLNRYHIPHYATTKKRSVGWTTIADLIDLNRLVINRKCKDTIKSLSSQVWVGSTKGVDVEGDFDDPADALRYFCMCGYIYSRYIRSKQNAQRDSQ